MKRKYVLIILIFVLLSILTGCGNLGQSDPPDFNQANLTSYSAFFLASFEDERSIRRDISTYRSALYGYNEFEDTFEEIEFISSSGDVWYISADEEPMKKCSDTLILPNLSDSVFPARRSFRILIRLADT